MVGLKWRPGQIRFRINSEVLVVWTGRCGCLRWVESGFCWDKSQVLVEQLGLVCATGSQKDGVLLEIGSDGFFDHTGVGVFEFFNHTSNGRCKNNVIGAR